MDRSPAPFAALDVVGVVQRRFVTGRRRRGVILRFPVSAYLLAARGRLERWPMSYGTFLNAPLSTGPRPVAFGVPHDTHATGPLVVGNPRGVDRDRGAFARPPGQLAEDPRAAELSPRVADVGDAPVVPNDLEQTTEAVGDDARRASRDVSDPVGGDHYISFPSFWGFGGAAYRDGWGTSHDATSTST